MAFKKTSGTITVDATLTEIGREKMAKGEFVIRLDADDKLHENFLELAVKYIFFF